MVDWAIVLESCDFVWKLTISKEKWIFVHFFGVLWNFTMTQYPQSLGRWEGGRACLGKSNHYITVDFRSLKLVALKLFITEPITKTI